MNNDAKDTKKYKCTHNRGRKMEIQYHRASLTICQKNLMLKLHKTHPLIHWVQLDPSV